MSLYPFEKQTDAAGHNVVGITFDRPIPWDQFDGGGTAGGESTVGERITEALDAEQTEAQKEHERAEALLGRCEVAGGALDPLTDPGGHLALSVQAARQALAALQRLQEHFAEASRIVSDSKPGPTAVREARAAALEALFAPEVISLLVEATAGANGAAEHGQRGSNVVSTEARRLLAPEEEG